MFTAAQLQNFLNEEPTGPNRLRHALAIAEVTQAKLATATGLTQPYISAIVNGRYHQLPVDTARKFTSFFGCQIEDLFPVRDQASTA